MSTRRPKDLQATSPIPEPPVDPAVSRRFAATRGKDTQPELAIRRRLHRDGFRFRVHAAPVQGLRRSGDIVFPRRRVVVLIDGCFFHGCPQHYISPKTRTTFWEEKISLNRRRDAETTRLFEADGWTVLRFWEHEDVDQVVGEIKRVVDSARSSRPIAGISSQKT